jgi:tetratricopeptide (TPR) repeat protein
MKYYLSLLFFGLLTLNSIAQTDSIINTFVPPKFKGGLQAFHEYLHKYLRYPPELYMTAKEGYIKATIFIDQNGNVKDVNTIGYTDELKNSVKRVLMLTPTWECGKLNGASIDTTVTKEIYFSIKNSRIKKDSLKFEILMISKRMDLDQAIEDLEVLNAADKNRAEVKAFYDKGVILLQNDSAANALVIFNQAEQEGFRNIDFYYNRGIANFKTGNKVPACRDWMDAARLGDDEALELYNKKCK